MSNIKKLFGTNKKKEDEGVWVPGPEGLEFLIAAASNDKTEKLTIELMRPYRRLARLNQMPKDKQEEISLTVISRTILLGWKGVKDDSGKEIPYTPEAGFTALKEAPGFANFVAGIAADSASFRDEEETERRGNLSSASSST